MRLAECWKKVEGWESWGLDVKKGFKKILLKI